MAALCTKHFVANTKKVFSSKSGPACTSVLSFKVKQDAQPLVRHESQLTDFKRGRGGRSSFSGIVATVFGASGYLGRHVVSELGRVGSQIIVPYRRDPSEVRDLKLAGDLGQVLFHPFFLKDEQSVRDAIKHSNVVINLMGKINETSNFSFDDCHHKGPAMIARICRELGVSRLIHMSAMNASTDPPRIFSKGSPYLISKSLGEAAVFEEFPNATVIRPAAFFGGFPGVSVYYVHNNRRLFRKLPMWKGGRKSVKQPVYVKDVAAGVMNAIFDKETAGKTYEFLGPKRYYVRDLVDHLYQAIRWYPRITTMPLAPYLLKARLRFPGKDPWTSVDKIEREFISDVPTGCPTLVDLGVPPTEITSLSNRDVLVYQKKAFTQEFVDMFAEPEPPITAEERDNMGKDPVPVYY